MKRPCHLRQTVAQRPARTTARGIGGGEIPFATSANRPNMSPEGLASAGMAIARNQTVRLPVGALDQSYAFDFQGGND